MTPTLSLCLITKNEEYHLPRCLESVRGLVDQIIVVDTGSTDRTVEVARTFGAQVSHFPWQDDFSMARNRSLEPATGEWILWLDADESITARDHDRIRAWLRRDDLNAVTALQRHYLPSATVVGWQAGSGGYEEGEPYPGYVDVTCRRLFRNRPSLRFRNRVHEELVSIDPRIPLAQARGDWVIHHFGKAGSPDVLRAKAEAYLRIGRMKIADDPRDPLAHYELGLQHAELENWDASAPCFERALALRPGFRDSQLQLAICHRRRGDYVKALEALSLAERTLPRHAPEIALEEGTVYRLMGDPEAAETAFRLALALNPTLAVASRNLTQIIMARARTLLRQRRFAEARDCLATVDSASHVDGTSHAGEIAGTRGAIALGLGRPDEAVTHLCESLRAHPTHEAALNLSIALEARGDRAGALEAATAALRLSPEEALATQRVARLSSGAERMAATTTGSRLLENGHVAVKQCRHGLFAYNLNDRYIGRSLDVYGEWAESELDLVSQVLKPGDVVLDVGANIGTHTVAFAKKVTDTGVVIAFEPQRLTFQLLCGNVALNALTNVMCQNVVVGEAPGSVLIPALDPTVEWNFGAVKSEGHKTGEQTPVVRIDDLRLRRCNLIKIDVEGAETRVLGGARATIALHRPVLFVENNSEEGSPAILRMLDGLGYSCWWHIPHYFNSNNYSGSAQRLFENYYEANVLCFPKEASVNAQGLWPVEGLDDSFIKALRRYGILRSQAHEV